MSLRMLIAKYAARGKRRKDVWKHPKGERFSVPRDREKPVKAFLYRPKTMPKPWPVLFNLHGGAWVGGDASQMDSYCLDMAEKCGAFIVNINYTKADVKPIPYAEEEIRDTVLYFRDHAEEYGLDIDRFALIGYSAGGHLAAAASLMLHDGGFSLSAQVLCYPFLDFNMMGVLAENDAQRQEWEEFFLGKNGDKNDPYLSPALATDKQMDGLSPAIFVCCGHDPLTSIAKSYAEKLEAAGVRTSFIVYDEALHGFLECNHKEYPPSVTKTPLQEKYAKQAENHIVKELKNIWSAEHDNKN